MEQFIFPTTDAKSTDDYRQILLTEIEKWLQPATDDERALAEEIQALSFGPVERVPNDFLEDLGMTYQGCHKNCRKFAAEEKSGRFRAVPGWQRSHGLYILHSVVAGRPGELVCVTPYRSGQYMDFDFAADPAIEITADGDFLRNGCPVPTGVRRNPEQTIAVMATAKRQLLTGADPYEVMVAAADAYATIPLI